MHLSPVKLYVGDVSFKKGNYDPFINYYLTILTLLDERYAIHNNKKKDTNLCLTAQGKIPFLRVLMSI